MSTRHRKRLLVDLPLQGRLIVRIIAYWFFCLLTIVTLAAISVFATQRVGTSRELWSTLWTQFGPVLVASCLVLPVVVLDCLRLSHRFAGPLFRLRDGLKRLGAGEVVSPITLRQNDMLQDIADDFNQVLKRVSVQGPNDGSTRA